MSRHSLNSSNHKHRILIVSYLFPPVGGIGVQRALSFAKYLPNEGYEVFVLRAKNAAAPVYDPGLLQHLSSLVTVEDAFTPELPFYFRQKLWKWVTRGSSPSVPGTDRPRQKRRPHIKQFLTKLGRRILCPEPEVLWAPFAIYRASRMVRKYKIDTVLVTAPPFSSFLVGNAIKRKFPSIQLISDFRDEWLGFYLDTFDYQRGGHTLRKAKRIEEETIRNSDLVTSVTASIVQQLQKRYPEERQSKFALVSNGYDPESFVGFKSTASKAGQIVVTHVGTVYSASSPRYYLDALDRLPETVRRTFQTRFVGRVTEEEQGVLKDRGSSVLEVGFVPQKEALREMAAADYLLLNMTDPSSLTGKLFEYLATGKPIVALAPLDGEVARTLQRTGAGWCIDPHDQEGIERLLTLLYERRQSGQAEDTPNWQEIRQYERPRLTAQFAALVEALHVKSHLSKLRDHAI